MNRPHGLPRWAILFIATVALIATATITRGALRTTASLNQPGAASAAATAGPGFTETTRERSELPGVRVVVSREDDGSAVVDAIFGDVGDLTGVRQIDPTPSTVDSSAAPAVVTISLAPPGSRAPPSSA